MEKEQFSQKAEKIRKIYQKIHLITFKYGIFILVFVIAARAAKDILNSSEASQNNLQINDQRNKNLSNFYKNLNQGKTIPDIKNYISLGEIKEDSGYIESYNNLLEYKGYIIPRFFQIGKTMPLEPIKYYEQGTYTVSDMDTFFKNMIIGTNKNIFFSNKNNQIPLQETIQKTFNLDCLFQTKLYNGICNTYINNFLTNFIVYTIESDIWQFETIFNTLIQKDQYKEILCKKTKDYLLYSSSSNEKILELTNQCSPQDQQDIQRIEGFFTTQNELESKFISKKAYKDPIINIYKLISFQQILYNDIVNKRVNIDRLNWYFEYIQELLKQKTLPKFYKEIIYYFNNYYIKTILETSDTTTKNIKKSDINDCIRQINAINNGNELMEIEGLSNTINQNLIVKTMENTDTIIKEDKNDIINTLLNQIENLSFEEKIISGNNILINGKRTLDNTQIEGNQEEPIIIQIKLRLIEDNKTLRVNQVDISENTEISKTINKLAKEKKRALGELQKYILQNKSLLAGQKQQDDSIIVCKNLRDQLPDQDINTCTNEKVILDTLRNGKIITMTISLNNFILTNININNTGAKEVISNYINQPDISNKIQTKNINKDTIVDFTKTLIQYLNNYKPTIATGTAEGSAKTIIIIEKVKKYLWVDLKDIAEKNGKFLIGFTILGVNFIGSYNIEEDKIQPIYFKDILSNNLPTMIQGLNLLLNDKNKDTLDLFTKDPIQYIKEKNPESYLLYQKFTSNSK